MMHFPRGFLVCGLGCALGLAACSSDSSSGGGASGGSTGGAAGSSGAGAGGTGGSSAGTSGSGGAGVGGNAGSAGGGGAAGSAGSGGATTAICVPNASYGSPLPADKSAKLVAGGYHFLEGPVWSTELSALFFSDMNFGASDSQGVPPSIVYRLAAGSSSPEVFIDTIGCNGNAIDQNGFLVSCTHDTRSVSRIDPVTKQRTLIADKFEGKAFNSPNDAIVRSDGTIYFTDPSWQLGSRPAEIGFKGVYRIDPQGNVTLVSQSLVSPNGAALSPDEKLLYVADDNTGNVHRFDVASDGTTSGGDVFVAVSGADGMAVDCAGNLYVTAQNGVRVFEPNGSELGLISVAEKPANTTFGGVDHTRLFVTAQTGLYAIDLQVPGLP
ncbi:MAG: SMP-30/gluconolactonase/LRE family protein [Polyangiaceae bacterium]